MKKYSENLKDPRWQKKRLEIMQRDNFTCQCCGDESTELHVHHKRYSSQLMVWEYDESELTTICKHCHKFIHYLTSFQFADKEFKLTTNNRMPSINKMYKKAENTYVMLAIFENSSLVIGAIPYDEDGEYSIDVQSILKADTVQILFEHINKNLNG